MSNDCIAYLESEEILACNVYNKLYYLKIQYEERKEKKFCGIRTQNLLDKLNMEKKNKLEDEYQKFYINILSYFSKQFTFNNVNLFYKLSNLQLTEIIDYYLLIDLIHQFPLLTVNYDEPFNEISLLNNRLKERNPSLSTNEKNELLFKPKQEYLNVSMVISFFLCIPISNAHVERAFSMLKKA